MVSVGSPALRDLHARLAASHERVAEMHTASASLQSSYAAQLQRFLGPNHVNGALPRFLSSVADVIEAGSAAVTLWGREDTVAAAMASDLHARGAQEIELVVGEGPAHAAVLVGGPVAAERDSLVAQWPHFARAVAEIDVHVVAAAPLQLEGAPFGALTVFDPPWPTVGTRLRSLQTVADALAESLGEDLGADLESTGEPVEGMAASPLLLEDRTAVVHQAAGMVAATAGCDIDSALALIRARAFADDVDCADLGAEIVAGRLQLRP